MITKKMLLVFPKTVVEKPIINDLVKYFNLTVSILRARISPEEEGHMLMEVTGKKEDIQKSVAHIKSLDIQVNESKRGMQWDEKACAHCGNCISHCPTDALVIADRDDMHIRFDADLCIECLNCIPNCPFGACTSVF